MIHVKIFHLIDPWVKFIKDNIIWNEDLFVHEYNYNEKKREREKENRMFKEIQGIKRNYFFS